ncbi:DUF58 domain-containing protein [Cytobacillus depressus]|uniref:DUF58 domain-containing protein n=2 Tax=Cytobacillus depressus TaxID=1602942 RepID=A0A6L3V672_9BACI|nr:DUF58 domain-containing protein [Cytobacillus depressus]
MSLWGRFLFQDRGILPTKRLLIIYSIVSLSMLACSALIASWTFVIVVNVCFILISFIDLLLFPRKQQIIIMRNMPEEMERGLTYAIQVEVKNNSEQSINFRLTDGIPQSFLRPFPSKGRVLKNTQAVITYDTQASMRGNYQIDKLYFRYSSIFNLWEKQMTVELPHSVKVIPDLTETKQYLQDAQAFLLYEGLAIRKQQSGIGDFAKIRNYVVGDDPRKINWRQTAKLREIMTNDYEPEHGKYITVLIDCGRMMGVELAKGNRLEKSLEAALTVIAAALQKGDYVSVLAFSNEVKVFVPPAKGMAHLQTILQAAYHLQVDAAESNYAAVLHYLETMQKKRSLILLFSDVGTFLHEDSALAYLKRLRQRHLFLMIGIEDMTLTRMIKVNPDQVQTAMMKSMAQQQMLIKKKEKIKWEKQGLLLLEAREEKLAVTAVSHYIEIMNRNLL